MPIRLAKKGKKGKNRKKIVTPNAREGMEKLVYPHKWYRLSKKRVWQFLKKLHMHQPCNPASASLNIRPREKSPIHTDTCAWMFIAALFTLGPNWKPHGRA